jgi:uncharacterized membrane protein
MALSTTDFHLFAFYFAVIGSPVAAFLLVALLQYFRMLSIDKEEIAK